MLVKIAIAIAIFFQLESNRESSNRLAAQMRDGHLRRVQDLVSGLPHPIAQIDFLVVIEKSLIEPAQILEQLSAQHHAAAALPVDFALDFTFEFVVIVLAQAQGDQEVMPVGGKWPGGVLIRSIGVEHPASKSARLGMLVSEFDPFI